MWELIEKLLSIEAINKAESGMENYEQSNFLFNNFFVPTGKLIENILTEISNYGWLAVIITIFLIPIMIKIVAQIIKAFYDILNANFQ